MLGDDESSCWQVAECQVPALLRDGVLSGNLSLAFTNKNLLAEVSRKGAFGKFSSVVGLLGRGSSSLVSPLSKDEGFS